MRMSSNENDLGYLAFLEFKLAHGRAPKVYLDGVEIRNAETADDQEGVVVRLSNTSRIPHLETLRGRVVIE